MKRARRSAIGAAAVVLAAVVGPARAQNAPVDDAEAQASIDAAKEALVETSAYPWYDAARDELRPLSISPPDPPADTTWSDWFANLPGLDSLASIALFGMSVLELLPWVLLILVVVLVIVFGLRFMLRRETSAAPAAQIVVAGKRLDPARLEALPFAVDRGVTDLLAEARRHYEAGDYGRAIVYLFSHQLVELDRHHLIRLTRGKTNRQYVRELGPRSGLARLLERTMVSFEEVFFGAHPLDRRRFEACWSELPQFDRLVAAGGAAP